MSGGGISKDMRDFLSQDFPNSNEVDIDLQDATRDNLYARTVPCTYFIFSLFYARKLETQQKLFIVTVIIALSIRNCSA